MAHFDEKQKSMGLSENLRGALAKELEKAGQQTNVTPEVAALMAMREISRRIDSGEAGLFDPTNSGDHLALALANMSREP